MRNPVHPGSIIKHECIEAKGMNVLQASQFLGVSRAALSRLINCKAGISPQMAIRLEQRFGSSAETWLKLQMAFDLAQTRHALQSGNSDARQ